MKINRLNAIEQYVLSKETVSIDELCSEFNVSKNTIRRDLNELEDRGYITKVYGGVTAVAPHEHLVPVPVRNSLNAENKMEIGKLAADLVEDGDTIFLDSGTTVCCMVSHLAQKKKVTLVTHSLSVLIEASKYENLNIISLGGIFSSPTGSFVGISTLESLKTLKISKAFMAATGVSIASGMTNTTFLEAEIKRGVVRNSSSIYLLADSSKVDKDAVMTFCRLENIQAFITDNKLPQRYIEFLKKYNIKLLY